MAHATRVRGPKTVYSVLFLAGGLGIGKSDFSEKAAWNPRISDAIIAMTGGGVTTRMCVFVASLAMDRWRFRPPGCSRGAFFAFPSPSGARRQAGRIGSRVEPRRALD